MNDDCNTNSGQRPDALSWSGLLECARDEVAALRQSSEYARSTAFKEKIDSLSFCMKELGKRLEHLGCVPNSDEPSFILLARDPQAPGLIELWASERAEVGVHKPEKVAEARAVAAAMRLWKESNPGMGMPSSYYAQRSSESVEPGDHAG